MISIVCCIYLKHNLYFLQPNFIYLLTNSTVSLFHPSLLFQYCGLYTYNFVAYLKLNYFLLFHYFFSNLFSCSFIFSLIMLLNLFSVTVLYCDVILNWLLISSLIVLLILDTLLVSSYTFVCIFLLIFIFLWIYLGQDLVFYSNTFIRISSSGFLMVIFGIKASLVYCISKGEQPFWFYVEELWSWCCVTSFKDTSDGFWCKEVFYLDSCFVDQGNHIRAVLTVLN